jgi:hypothetical protein
LGSGGSHHHTLPKELEAFRRGMVFFWTVGNPRSQDDAGFTVRAKLRLVTKEKVRYWIPLRGISAGSDVWLLVDKIYPENRWFMLLEHMDELQEWFTSYCLEHKFVMKGKEVIQDRDKIEDESFFCSQHIVGYRRNIHLQYDPLCH